MKGLMDIFWLMKKSELSQFIECIILEKLTLIMSLAKLMLLKPYDKDLVIDARALMVIY